MSYSVADLVFPSYGQARHFDQSNEYLGMVGQLYDGVGIAFEPDLLRLTVTPTVGDQWGTGDYEWLSVWIDWDVSRQWEADERVVDLADAWFEYGTHAHVFEIPVPDDAYLPETWMRVRFSFDGPHGPAGDLYTGEVEDYLLGDYAPPIPEPSVIMLLGLGLSALGVGERFRRRR